MSGRGEPVSGWHHRDVDTPKLALAAQRYDDAEDAREAAADDLKAESAAALAQGVDEDEVAEAIGRPLEDLHRL